MANFIRAVLWDMDGVLVDTSERHYATWSQVLGEAGIPFNREQFQKIFGRKNSEFLSVIFGRELDMATMLQLSERKERLFREGLDGQVRTMPGVKEWLARLKNLGFRQAVASSAPQANVDALVDGAGIRSYFDAVVSSADLPGKPDPAVFLRAAELLEVPADRCVVFEDAVPGVEAAKRAGMRCIATTASNPADALQAADLVVKGLDELKPEDFWKVIKNHPVIL